MISLWEYNYLSEHNIYVLSISIEFAQLMLYEFEWIHSKQLIIARSISLYASEINEHSNYLFFKQKH